MLPSNPEVNPKQDGWEHCNAIIMKSGLVVKGE